jgi:Fur family transcriptional regulator, ferric uptake regulator
MSVHLAFALGAKASTLLALMPALHSHTKTSRDPHCLLCQSLEKARSEGLRMTPALENVLRILIESETPLTLGDITESEKLTCHADRATVFRLLTKLEKLSIIRRLGAHDRAAYYTLLLPDAHNDYLVCTECGTIKRLEIDCPVEALEAQVAKKSKFTHIYHELMFFGTCPECAK